MRPMCEKMCIFVALSGSLPSVSGCGGKQRAADFPAVPRKTPKKMPNNCHLSQLIQEQARVYGDRAALMYRDYDLGRWLSVSWRDFALQVGRVSRSLLALGVEVQERVAVFSQNKPECLYVDFGAFGVRAVTTPFYATSSPSQVQYMMNDAEVRYVFVGEQEQYDIMLQAAPQCHTLKQIIIFDATVKRADHDTLSITFDEFLRLGRQDGLAQQVADRTAEASFDDMANILYTSGTTGQPKGVVLLHSQYHAAFEGHYKVLPVTDQDVVMNFLPFTHVFERGWSLLCLSWGCTLAVNLRPKDVQQSMVEVHPTCMSAVPRFWEKVYQAVLNKAEQSGKLQRSLIYDAIKVCGDYWEHYQSKGIPAPFALRMKVKAYQKTVIPVLRRAIGIERSTCFPTAGAAVSPEVERFVHAAGIDMGVGYGLTESMATVSCDNLDKTVTMGSIGRPLPGVEVRIGADNEIQLHGPTITRGYYRKPEETAKAFTEDGWFRTGDAGYLKDGELYMTERIKDLFKTSNGKYIAPQLIEGKLTIDRFMEQAVIVADKHKFVSALIVPSYTLVEEWCQAHGVSYADREDMCRNPKVHDMLWQRIETLQQDLAPYEQVKRFILMPRPFVKERGEVTDTLKIKRRAVYENYAELIETMYE